jgi:methylmalonyl-CoA mutase
MADRTDDLSLAAEFPPATREAWTKLVEGVLKGADFEKKLVSRTYDGIRIEPLYEKAEPRPQPGRGAQGRWRIAQKIDHPEPLAANELALADLEGGADALAIVLARAPAARGFGVRIETVDDLDRALAGVMLDLVHLRLDSGGFGRQTAAMLVALAERRNYRLADLDIDLGLDPIGVMAAMGKLSASWDIVAARCADTLTGLQERGFAGTAFLADGRPYHEAGASEGQELAATLATSVAYLRALEAGGHPVDAARDALSFLLVADADEFLTVAKLRALRRLWARVEEACGLTPKPIRLHAETAWRMTTRRDPWVNMLRATVAAFSAGVGGADSIAILPFTAALGLPDAFARRIARNTQLILLEESNLWRVADPAAGSGGFEALTDALCETAWGLFQEIEREGGIVESLGAGALQARIAAVRDQRARAVAARRDPITGTSAFPDLAEAEVAVLIPSPLRGGRTAGQRQAGREAGQTFAAAPFPASGSHPSPRMGEGSIVPFSSLIDQAENGATLAELAASAPGGAPIAIAPLPSTRAAEPFERLRDASDAALAETGSRPRVFLANLGPVSAFTPRTIFAKNLFEAGGFEIRGNSDQATPAEVVEAGLAWLQNQPVKRICLCSSDEIYVEEAAATARMFRGAGATRIALAGRPSDLEPTLREAGIDVFIFTGCDVLAILESLHAREA